MHVWESTYHEIQIGNGCPFCAGKLPKTKEDYKNLAKFNNGEYILNHIPDSAKIPIEGWKCVQNHIWSACYNNILNGTWCPICYKENVNINIEDYKNLAKSKNGEYILDYIPQTANTSINAWKCEFNHIWNACYSRIKKGSWCPFCYGNARKIKVDYQILAKSNDGEYILDYIPQNVGISIKGWKCNQNHIWKACYTAIKQGTWCPICSQSKSETLVRNIIEEEINLKFIKIRPNFLKYKNNKNLELDGYNEKYQLAFEYQGRQHYSYIPHFHDSEEDFKYQQEKDIWKYKKCIQEDISLMIIPCEYTFKNPVEMKNYIKTQIILLKWDQIVK